MYTRTDDEVTHKAYLRKLGGRYGNATHSKRGRSSHVNTKRNKRAASKGIRKR